MKLSLRSLLWLFVAPFLLVASSSRGSQEINPICFDFNRHKPYVTPLKPPIALLPDKDNSESGEFPDKVGWGSARGVVAKSISELYEKLLDHYTWKPADKHKLQVTPVVKPGYLEFHDLKVNLRPFAFISIDWEEQWAYALAGGTVTKPQKIVISYQKSGGSDKIEKMCGSVTLTKISPKETDIAFYQELKASHQDKDDIVKDELGTLETLRGKKK